MRPPVALTLAIAMLTVVPVPARADERVIAGPGIRYATPNVSIDQGEALFLLNQDLTAHDVVAVDSGPDAEPLFRSPLVASGGQAEVAGVKSLTTGEYAFVCSIHPSMQGHLTVTTAGAPVPRPDSRAPVVAASLRGRRPAAIAGGVRLRVLSDEPATLRARARVRVGGRVYRGRQAAVELVAGRAVTLRLMVPAAATRAARRARRAAVEVAGRAVDAAGNASAVSVRRVLRR